MHHLSNFSPKDGGATVRRSTEPLLTVGRDAQIQERVEQENR